MEFATAIVIKLCRMQQRTRGEGKARKTKRGKENKIKWKETLFLQLIGKLKCKISFYLWAATKLFEASLKNYIFPATGDRSTKTPKALGWSGKQEMENVKWEMGNGRSKRPANESLVQGCGHGNLWPTGNENICHINKPWQAWKDTLTGDTRDRKTGYRTDRRIWRGRLPGNLYRATSLQLISIRVLVSLGRPAHWHMELSGQA